MGSPLAPILEDIFMAQLKETGVKEIRHIVFYCRYVDVAIVIATSK